MTPIFISQFLSESRSMDELTCTVYTTEGQHDNNDWLIDCFDLSLFDNSSTDFLPATPNNPMQWDFILHSQNVAINNPAVTIQKAPQTDHCSRKVPCLEDKKQKRGTSSAVRAKRWRAKQKMQMAQLKQEIARLQQVVSTPREREKEITSLQEKLREVTLQRNQAVLEISNLKQELRNLVMENNDRLRNENIRLQKLVSAMKLPD